MGKDRRRYPRAVGELDVTVEAGGRQWKTKTVDLSPYGVKVAPPATSVKLPPGTSVQLRLSPHDQDPPLSLTASVARTDADGVALRFDSLEDQQFQRLKSIVDSLLMREWHEVLDQIGTGPPPAARAGITTEPLAQSGVRANDSGKRASARKVERAKTEESSVTGSPSDSEQERLQALLNRRGFGELRLPSNGPLARQWLEFLRQLEAEG